MHTKYIPGTKRNQKESPAGIQRLHLLDWRFSATEIHRLSIVQIQFRDQPDALDLPLDVCRLRFARWLAEQGRIGEATDANREQPPWEEEPWEEWLPSEPELAASLPASPTYSPFANPNGQMASESGRVQRSMPWRLALCTVLSRIRQGIARATRFAGASEENQEYPEGDAAFWGLYGWPYGWPYGGMRLFEVPSIWMHY